MAKFGGFGGGGFGGGNMQSLMKQAQKMQEEAQKAQEVVNNTEIEGESAGGMVKVKMTGNKTPLSIKINPETVDDIEMLEDLILVALKDASEKADEFKESKLGRLGGGLM